MTEREIKLFETRAQVLHHSSLAAAPVRLLLASPFNLHSMKMCRSSLLQLDPVRRPFATKRERRRKLAGRSPLPERRHRPENDGVESHTSSCRNNLQRPEASRRQGSWAPSPSCTGVFGAPPFLCTDATHPVLRVPLFCGSWAAFSLSCQPGSSESAHCVTWWVSGSPPFVRSTIARWQATDPEFPKGGSQPTPRLLGVAKRWCCFGSYTLPSRTVALFTQSYPAVLEVTLYSVGATDDWTSCELECAKTPPVRDDSAWSHLMSALLG